MADAQHDGGGGVSGRACPGTRGGGDGRPGVDLDVSWLVEADLAAVEALARLQLVAARRGWSLRLHGAQRELVGLVELSGLHDVLGPCACPPPFPGSPTG